MCRSDYDSPWKQAIARYFGPFLEFFFPAIHREIDWEVEPRLLDHELQQLCPEAKIGRRHADLLIEVTTRAGSPALVLVHVEVQSQVDKNFEERMFVYHYRIYDAHRREVVSLAILGDDCTNWRPKRYHRRLWGCHTLLTFPTAKLLDYESRETPWSNPFTWVVKAHLQAQRASATSRERLEAKFALVRGLRLCGLQEEDIREFYGLIHWFMALSDELEAELQERVRHFEEENGMREIPTIEMIDTWRAREGALREAVLELAQARWGVVDEALSDHINSLPNEASLKALLLRVGVAASREELGSLE